ncbi:MAG: formate/nitrite transporter family protein [Ruminiclostridium sp.]
MSEKVTNSNLLAPEQIAEQTIENATKKAKTKVSRLLVLAILAGAFIAFASEGSNAAIYNIPWAGVGKALAGALFSTGLMLVIVAGGELFTGNTLMVAALAQKKIRWGGLLKNWATVYAGNFIGAVLIAWFIFKSGQLSFSNGLLGGFTIKMAAYKISLGFSEAFFLGIMCNWLVSLAIWMAYGTKDMAGRLLAIFFPIWLFITSGFEHCVANMYYIPVGIMAKANSDWVKQAISLGASPDKINSLNWVNFLTHNLIPVTLGNIIGGVVFTGMAYWFVYLYKKN